jgi:hypothetical protein
MGLLTVLGLAGAAALTIPSAGAGGGSGVAPATIDTVAVNAPAGTTFTVNLTCDNTAIIPPGGSPATDVDTIDFTYTVDAAGQAVPDGTNTVFFDNEAQCTVTETNAGGAGTTSYACADNSADLIGSGNSTPFPGAESTTDPGSTDGAAPAAVAPSGEFCATNGPQAEPIVFQVVAEEQEVIVTVTNTFAVVSPITFTG